MKLEEQRIKQEEEAKQAAADPFADLSDEELK